MTRMRLLGGAAGACMLLIGCSHAAPPPPEMTNPQAMTDPQAFSQIERGRYLAVAGDCAACHDQPGGAAFAGGRPIETPFGNVVASNITPDQQTGIGAWTDEQFIRAMTKGIGLHGKRLYPAMPYPYFAKVTVNDLLAIRAYLNTVNPVPHKVHADTLPFPFNIRLSMAVWNRLFYTPGAFQPDPHKSAEWNRGAYLAQGLNHCAACHTPKDFLGGDQSARAFRGGVLQDWFAPNITTDARSGLGGWSVEDIVEYLKTGVNRHTTASGPMAEEVMNSSSHMTLADLRAIAVYLKDLPGGKAAPPTPLASGAPEMKIGQAIYIDQCAACHTTGGDGIERLFPTLKGTPFVQAAEPTSLIRVVLEGTRAVTTQAAPTGAGMPAFGWKLDDAQVAAVLSYIRNAWGNAAPAVTAAQVKSLRGTLASR